MKSIDELTPEEVEDLNDQTREELLDDLEERDEQRAVVVSSAIKNLISVTESEAVDIEFSGPAGSCTITVMVSPPQKIFEDLVKIATTAEKQEKTSSEDTERMCEILEYLCIEPKIPKDVWMSGQLSDDIPARIIVELMKHKALKHDSMESELTSFRQNKRGTKNTRGRRTPKNTTKSAGKSERK